MEQGEVEKLLVGVDSHRTTTNKDLIVALLLAAETKHVQLEVMDSTINPSVWANGSGPQPWSRRIQGEKKKTDDKRITKQRGDR